MATLQSKEEIMTLPEPSGSLSYGDRIVNAGDFFWGMEGERTLILTSGFSVYYQCSKPTWENKHMAGQVYLATAEEVRNDMQWSGAGTVSRNLKVTQSVIKSWLDGCLAAAALVGGPVGWAATALPIMDLVSKHAHKAPAYTRLAIALTKLRVLMNPNCEVMRDKIIGGLLIELAKAMPGMAFDMVWGYAKGKVISKAGLSRIFNYGLSIKNAGPGWNTKIGKVKDVMTGVVKKVVTHLKTQFLKDMKKEALSTDQKLGLAKWVITYLGTGSVTLSQTEALRVIDELIMNFETIGPAVDELIAAMDEVAALNAA